MQGCGVLLTRGAARCGAWRECAQAESSAGAPPAPSAWRVSRLPTHAGLAITAALLLPSPLYTTARPSSSALGHHVRGMGESSPSQRLKTSIGFRRYVKAIDAEGAKELDGLSWIH